MLYPLSYEGGAGRKRGRELPAATYWRHLWRGYGPLGGRSPSSGLRIAHQARCGVRFESSGGGSQAARRCGARVVRAWCSSSVSEFTIKA